MKPTKRNYKKFKNKVLKSSFVGGRTYFKINKIEPSIIKTCYIITCSMIIVDDNGTSYTYRDREELLYCDKDYTPLTDAEEKEVIDSVRDGITDLFKTNKL